MAFAVAAASTSTTPVFGYGNIVERCDTLELVDETHWITTKVKTSTFSVAWKVDNLSQLIQRDSFFDSPPFCGSGETKSLYFILRFRNRSDCGRDFDHCELSLRQKPAGRFGFGSFGVAVAPSVCIKGGKQCHAAPQPQASPGQRRAIFDAYITNAKGERLHAVDERLSFHALSDQTGFGYPRFVRREDLIDRSRGLVHEDQLIIVCTISVLDDAQLYLADNVGPPQRALTTVNHRTEADLSEASERALNGGLFSDVRLRSSDGREFPVHRVMLAVHSKVFRAMFETGMKEKSEQTVDIKDFNTDVISDMLAFMYTGTVPNVKSLASELLAAADKYNVAKLKAVCEDDLASAVTTDNAAALLVLGHRYSAARLKSAALHWISRHVADVLETEGWKSLSKDYPDLVLLTLQEVAKFMRHMASEPGIKCSSAELINTGEHISGTAVGTVKPARCEAHNAIFELSNSPRNQLLSS